MSHCEEIVQCNHKKLKKFQGVHVIEFLYLIHVVCMLLTLILSEFDRDFMIQHSMILSFDKWEMIMIYRFTRQLNLKIKKFENITVSRIFIFKMW